MKLKCTLLLALGVGCSGLALAQEDESQGSDTQAATSSEESKPESTVPADQPADQAGDQVDDQAGDQEDDLAADEAENSADDGSGDQALDGADDGSQVPVESAPAAVEQPPNPVEAANPELDPELELRKRQLVAAYYSYRGDQPDAAEFKEAMDSIDAMGRRGATLGDIRSTIFNLLVNEPKLSLLPFARVVPPNLGIVNAWNQARDRLTVRVKYQSPEFSLRYQTQKRRKDTLVYGGGIGLAASYLSTVLVSSGSFSHLYNQVVAWNAYARSVVGRETVSASMAGGLLSLIPLAGGALQAGYAENIAEQLRFESQNSSAFELSYSSGGNLFGAILGTLLQGAGAVALLVGLNQDVPDPFEKSAKPVAIQMGPGSLVISGSF